MKVFSICLEMSSDPKKYFGFTFYEFSELLYTAKIAQYFGFTFHEFTELVYAVKSLSYRHNHFVRLLVMVSNRLNARQSKTKQFLESLCISKESSGNSVKISDCWAFSPFKTLPGSRAFIRVY